MVAKNDPAVTIRDGEFTISRVFDAPRELVWKALTEVERLKQWWGPKGFTVKTAEVDLRPGGTFLYCLVAPEGFEMWGKWTYREIVAPERLVIVSSFSDGKGNPIRHPMEPTWPLRMLGTSTLTERDGKTTLTIATSAYEATEDERKTFEAGFDSMADGFNGTFDELADYLASAKA
jgi:uncharacterized protein YndB with AHSA1/START domain